MSPRDAGYMLRGCAWDSLGADRPALHRSLHPSLVGALYDAHGGLEEHYASRRRSHYAARVPVPFLQLQNA